jgi:hypothetical protein
MKPINHIPSSGRVLCDSNYQVAVIHENSAFTSSLLDLFIYLCRIDSMRPFTMYATLFSSFLGKELEILKNKQWLSI